MGDTDPPGPTNMLVDLDEPTSATLTPKEAFSYFRDDTSSGGTPRKRRSSVSAAISRRRSSPEVMTPNGIPKLSPVGPRTPVDELRSPKEQKGDIRRPQLTVDTQKAGLGSPARRFSPKSELAGPGQDIPLHRATSKKLKALQGPTDASTYLSVIRSSENPDKPVRRSLRKSSSFFKGGKTVSAIEKLRREEAATAERGGQFRKSIQKLPAKISAYVRGNRASVVALDTGGDTTPMPAKSFKQRAKDLVQSPSPLKRVQSPAFDEAEEEIDVDFVPYTIHPASRFKEMWQAFIFVLVLYNAIVLPLDIAFFEMWGLDESSGGGLSAFGVVDVLLDILFIVDVVLNFRTGYYEKDGELVFSTKRIAYNYCWTSGWAMIDIPASIPFDAIIYIAGASNSNSDGGARVQATKLLKLLKAPRLLRIGRIAKVLRGAEAVASVGKIVGLLIFFLYAAHFCGCFFFYICTVEETSVNGVVTDSWAWREGISGYITGMGASSRENQWTTVLFAAFLMLIGENTDPGTTGERVFTVVVMLCGAVVYATMFSQIAILIGSLNRTKSRYNELLNDVNEHMRNLQLPLDIQDRVHLYYRELWHLNRCLDREVFFDRLSPALKAEICLWLYGESVQQVPFLASVAPDFVVKLVQSLQNVAYLPGDFIVREGEIGAEMYFLRKGRCEVLKRSLPGKVLVTIKAGKSGSFFGEIAIMVSNTRRTAMIRAVTFCDVAVLSAEQFQDLMGQYPGEAERIRERVRRQMSGYKDEEGQKALRALERQIKVQKRWKDAAAKATGALRVTRHLSEIVEGKTNAVNEFSASSPDAYFGRQDSGDIIDGRDWMEGMFKKMGDLLNEVKDSQEQVSRRVAVLENHVVGSGGSVTLPGIPRAANTHNQSP